MRRIILVTGPPCAGKTTHVRTHAQPGDQVLDQDEIGAKAMTAALRRLAYTGGTTWVIRCAPGPTARAALVRQLGAEHVHLTAPRDQLVARAAHRPDRRRHIAAIGKWFTAEAADRTPTVTRSTVAPSHHGRPSAGRRGRRWREAKAKLHAISQICWLCGHGGAREADHDPPRKVLLKLGLDPNDLQYLRPAHGGSCPCPTCGQACNQVRGAGERTVRMSCEW